MRVISYTVLFGASRSRLIELVHEYINSGYEPIGGTTFAEGEWNQAMIFREPTVYLPPFRPEDANHD